MHVVDVTMFYAGGGGGVTTYLDAKARWLASHTAIRHTIASSNLPRQAARAGPAWPSCLHHMAAIDSFALPGLHGYRMPRSAAAVARVLLGLQPALIEAGDAGPCGWGAVRVKQRLGVPLVCFYHSDLPQLVGRRFGAAVALAAQQYVQRLYRHCDRLLAPSAAMVGRLAAMGLSASRQPLGVDTAIFHPGRGDGSLRAELGLPASARLLSRMALPALALAQSGAPLVRLSLYPRDARHPELLHQIQAIVARLLANREALTKAGYARRLPAPAMAG